MIKILHMYPNLLNTFGGAGDIKVLTRYLMDQGQDFIVDTMETGDDVKLVQYNLIYVGAGTEDKTIVALDDITRYKEDLKTLVDLNANILMVGSASLMAYDKLIGIDGYDNDGLGLVKGEVKLSQRKNYSDIYGITSICDTGILGAVFTSAEISDNNNQAFIDIKHDSNTLYSGHEGFKINNCFGTEIVGPLFARNPEFLKQFCSNLLGVEPVGDDPLWLQEAFKGYNHALIMMKVEQ